VTAPWDRRSPAEQERVAELVLGQWLPAAVAFSATWSELARDEGLATTRLDGRDDLARFPPSREVDLLRASGPGAPGLVMRPTEDQVKAHATGSTLLDVARAIRRDAREGKRRALLTEYKPVHVHRGGVDDELAVAYSRRDLDRLHRAGARAARLLGLDDSDYLVNAVPAGPRLAWWGVHHLALGASILALHPRGAGDDLERLLPSFALIPVTAVAVTVDEALPLAELVADDADIAFDRVDTVVLVGPPPDDETRDEITEAWSRAGAARDVRVRSLWAPSEARALWAECREGTTGLHTFPDLEVAEVLDPLTGLPSDGDGDLVYTSAGWHGSALLRYQTGAYVGGVDRAACPACGRTVPRVVGDVAPHAWQVAAHTAAGWERVDMRGVAAVLSGAPGVETWRVEVGPDGRRGATDRVLVEVAASHLDDAEREGLRRRLENATGSGRVELAVVADRLVVDRHVDELGSVFADLTG
jgi:hypothetical protein